MNRNHPAVGPRPTIPYDLSLARLMTRALAKPDDTIAAVAAENNDVFRRPPCCDERHAPLLRALAADLMFAGIDGRCGLRVEAVVDDGAGFHVQPRFEDGLLSWIVDAFENLSQEPSNA